MGRYNQSICAANDDNFDLDKLLSEPIFSKTVNGFIALSVDTAVSVNNRYYGISSLTASLPSEAENGDSITFYREVGTEMTVVCSDGSLILTSKGPYDTVIIDVPEEVIFTFSLGKWMVL